ncbi:MAG TPA: VWA domain-containing protein [Anaerolineae bacterium]
MRFENPGALLLLPVLLIAFLALGVTGWKTREEIAQSFRLDGASLKRKQIEKYALVSLLGALWIIASALPAIVSSAIAPSEKAGEIALMVDVSGSMAAQVDVRSPSRLKRVQSMLDEIVDRLNELGQPRVSLHGYTNIARSIVPFVGPEDYGFLKESIANVLDIYSTPGQGSVLGQSILDVIKKFTKDGKVKLVVLFGDGEAFLGLTRGMRGEEQALLEMAIQRAKEADIPIVCIGVGETQGAKIPLYNIKGEFTGEYARLQGVDYVSYLEPMYLKEIADQTGGMYLAESSWRELIPLLRERLAVAEPVSAGKEVKVYHSIAPWFLLAALPVWLVFVLRHLLD